MIEEMKKAAVEKILWAVKDQRWYFIENNPKILLDKNTMYLWANLECFPYQKDNGNHYEWKNAYEEVRNLMIEINSQNWGGYSSWRIPYTGELWTMVEDKAFSFMSGPNWQVRNFYYWCVNFWNGKEYVLAGKDLDDNGSETDISLEYYVNVIPCCGITFNLPNEYWNKIYPTNNFYSELEKLQFTLDVFTMNNLIPIFKDYRMTELYKIIFVDKKLFKLIFFDELLLAGYDLAAIEKSAIKYFDAVANFADTMLEILQEYEAAHEKSLSELLKVAMKLKLKFTESPHLTAEENSLLAERQKFLSQRLAMSTDEVKAQILLAKAQAERFFERLDKINRGGNSISELVEFEAEPRIKFEFLAENLARIVRDSQRKLNFFVQNKNFVAVISNSCTEWSDSYKSFKTSLREELTVICREENIEEEIFAAWYSDWQKKRFAIEERYLPLVEFALKGNFLDSVERILKILGDYRDSVDKFYLHERKNIYQKFAFTAGGDLQEKFETESELYKLAEKFQRDLQEIIFSRDKTEERIFLLRWAEPILNISIDEISNFIRDKELDAISEEVLTQFAELKRKNFAEYLADSKSYGDAVQKREKEFNALIFRMRKDLHKK